MTEADRSPIFSRGDVVYGDDPFKRTETPRPWVICTNHEGRPFHGDQYIALTLTSKSWMDDLIDIPESSWIRGGTPQRSRIVPWGVQSLGRADIGHWQGTIAEDLVESAVEALMDELR